MRYIRRLAGSVPPLAKDTVSAAQRGPAVALAGSSYGAPPSHLAAGRSAVALSTVTAAADERLEAAERAEVATMVLGLAGNPNLPLRGGWTARTRERIVTLDPGRAFQEPVVSLLRRQNEKASIGTVSAWPGPSTSAEGARQLCDTGGLSPEEPEPPGFGPWGEPKPR